MSQTIFDPLRKKEVFLTPEEKVRQQVIEWLRDKAGVPVGLMSSEYSLKYNGRDYRSDIVVFDKMCKPLMLIECKANTVKIDQTVFDQITKYNRVLKVPYLMVTNGISVYVCRLADDKESYIFLNEVPGYDAMLQR